MDTPRSAARGLLTRYRYPLLIALVLICIGAVALHAETGRTGAGVAPVSAPTVTSSTPPGLTWNQTGISPSVVAGATATTTTIFFTATGKLPNAVVALSPNLAGLVSVSPTNLGTVIQGQTVPLTLTASAPASSTPALVQGSVQIEKEEATPLEVYGSSLPINLQVTWPAAASPLVTINYPPGLIAQGGQIGQPVTSAGADGGTYIDLPLSTAGNPAISMVRVVVYPNSGSQTLTQWFEQNVDTDGALLQSGFFTSETYPDGKTALVSTGIPIPSSYSGPPVSAYSYVIAPNGEYIASVNLAQDKTYLYQLGYSTPDALNSMLQSITATLTFNR